MPCNLELYPLDFPASLSTTGADALALEVTALQRTAEAIAIAILQNQRTYGYDISMLQDAIGGGGLNAVMPLTIVSGASNFVPAIKGTKGYWGGGQTTGRLTTALLDRFTFSDKAISRLGINFAKPRYLAGTVASKTNIYWAGGTHSDVDRLTTATEALATVGTLATGSQVLNIAGLTAAAAGYIVGGYDATETTVGTIQKIAFPNDAVTVLSAALPTPIWGGAAVGNAIAGYIGGGFNTASTPSLAVIHKFLYGSEAASVLGSSLATPRRSAAGLGSETAGYFVTGLGGDGILGTGIALASVEKITYSGEAISTLGITFGSAQWVNDGLSNSAYGYIGGGFVYPYNALRTISELSYVGEALTLLGIGLSESRYGASAASDYSPGWGN